MGVIVLAILGNAAEQSTAVLMAMKNKMDLALHITIGSAIQMALFVAPILVFASMLMGHSRALDLQFTLLEMITMILAVGVLAMVSRTASRTGWKAFCSWASTSSLPWRFIICPVGVSEPLRA